MQINLEYSIKSLTFTAISIIVSFGVLCVFGVHPPVKLAPLVFVRFWSMGSSEALTTTYLGIFQLNFVDHL